MRISLCAVEAAKTEGRSVFPLPPPILLLVHQGRAPYTGPLDVSGAFQSEDWIEPYLPHQKLIPLELNNLPMNEVPDDPETPELWITLCALQLAFAADENAEEMGEAIFERSKELKGRRDGFTSLIWHYVVSYLERRPNMEETIMAITDKAREAVEEEEEIPGGWLFLQELKAKGRDEGRAEGEAKGKAEGQRNAIFSFLQTRFGAVSQKTAEYIERQTDSERLNSIIREAAIRPSLEDFEKVILSI
jgi:hypothetical protein